MVNLARGIYRRLTKTIKAEKGRNLKSKENDFIVYFLHFVKSLPKLIILLEQ